MSGRFGPFAVGGALVLALATFVIFAGFTPIIPTPIVVLTILVGDGLIVVFLLVLIGLELRSLRAARRAARAGARLHNRVVALFSLVAAIPALVTAVVATVSVEWAINPAFMKDVGAFLDESGAAVATIPRIAVPRLAARSRADGRRSFAERAPAALRPRPVSRLSRRARPRAGFHRRRGDQDRRNGGRRRPPVRTRKLIAKPESADFTAAAGASAVLRPAGRRRGVRRDAADRRHRRHLLLRGAGDRARWRTRSTRDASAVSAVFANFESHRHNIELGFASVFVMLSLTLLISAVWMGLTFANQLVGPIRRLIRATDEVASGNLYVQVPTRRSEGDLGHLGETFNKMTMELRQQRNHLTAANALNDERRAFIEAVLSGVPACVLGVDRRGRRHGQQRRRRAIAAARTPTSGGLVGRRIEDVFPRLAQILAEARSMNLQIASGAGDPVATRPRAPAQRARHRRSASAATKAA